MHGSTLKTILVTGANGALGQAIVDDLMHTHAYNVIGVYRGERSEGLLKVLRKHGEFDDNAYSCELADDEAVHELVKNIFISRGCVPWGVVNVAGSSLNSMSWKTSHAQFMEVINNNLMTTVNVCRHLIPYMRNLPAGGRIINTSSVVAFSGAPGAAHYAAAKAAIVGYTKSLSLELAPKMITANTVALGYFDRGLITQLTPELQESVKSKIPLQRFGRAIEASSMIRYLLSDNAAYVTGQTLHVNGGIL